MIRSVLCLALMLSASAAASQTANIAGWEIGPADDRKSCFMGGDFNGGTSVVVIASATDPNVIYSFTNKKWRGIVDGKKYKMIIEVDDMGEWTVNTVGMDLSTGKGFGFNFPRKGQNGENFVTEFALGHNISITREDGTPVEKLNLTGSREATVALFKCVGLLRNSPAYDPFEGEAETNEKPISLETSI